MEPPAGSFYESARILAEYLLFHFGRSEEVLPWPDGPTSATDFPRRCATEGPDFTSLPAQADVLDLGCAVGRTTFELAARGFRCLGVDYSATFINAARELLGKGSLTVRIPIEGNRSEEFTARCPECDPANVRFEVGDAQQLRGDIGSYDLVLACNLLCRLQSPVRLLTRLPELVRLGGQLFLTTPCTWLEEFTPPHAWLCHGHSDTLAGLRAVLEPHFVLLRRTDMPFLIREHSRKFQWSVALGTLWRRA